jgi:hypothetical protein
MTYTQWKEEEKKETQTLDGFVALVAKYLGKEWYLKTRGEDDPTNYAEITREDGATITVKTVWNKKDRWQFRGSLTHEQSKEMRSWGESVTITVAKERGPAVAAAEITRRLLPEYLKQREELTAKAEKTKQYHADMLAGITKVSEAIGKPLEQYHREYPAVSLGDVANGGWYGDAEPYTAGTIKIELRGVPADLACKMLRVLEGKE